MKSSVVLSSGSKEPTSSTPLFKPAKDEIAGLKKELQEAKVSNNKLREDVSSSHLEIASYRGSISQYKSRIATLENEIEEVRILNDDLRKLFNNTLLENVSLSESIESNVKLIKKQEEKINELYEESKKTAEELKSANILNETNQHIENDRNLTVNLTEFQAEMIRDLREQNAELHERIELLSMPSADLQQDFEESFLVEKEYKRFNETLEKMVRDLRRELAEAREEHKHDNTKYNLTIDSLKKNITYFQNKIEELTSEFENKLTSYENKLIHANKNIETITSEKNVVSSVNTLLVSRLHEVTIQNARLVEENRELNNQILALQENERLNRIEKNALKMQAIKNQFNRFIDVYIEQNHKYQDSYFCFGMFSRHGGTGREAARKFEVEFNCNKKQITSKLDLLTYLNDLQTENQELLAGNYYDDSFKTYLLAYYDYVSKLNMAQDFVEFDIASYVKSYAARTNIEAKFGEIFPVRIPVYLKS